LLFDVLFLIYILVNVYFGYRYGLFRRIIQLGAFFLGMLLAQALSPGLAEQFGYNTSAHPADAHFGVFLAVVFGMVIVGEVLGFAYADALGFLNSMLGDRFFGAALGLVESVLELSVLIYLFGQMYAVALPAGGAHADIVVASQDQLNHSILAPQIKRIQGAALFLFQPVLPPEPGTYFAKTYS
jgi:uncharacterized membrane protein required for colicin V production